MWKDKLTESERSFMLEIVSQIPETMGVRDFFEKTLEKLADGGAGATAPKFNYIIVTDGDVQGTADRDLALQYANDDECYVIDVAAGQWIVDEAGETSDVTELK